jgi:hypothetical protein
VISPTVAPPPIDAAPEPERLVALGALRESARRPKSSARERRDVRTRRTPKCRCVLRGRPPLPKSVDNAPEHSGAPLEIAGPDATADVIRPRALRALDAAQRGAAGGRQSDELRPAVTRVLVVGDHAIGEPAERV